MRGSNWGSGQCECSGDVEGGSSLVMGGDALVGSVGWHGVEGGGSLVAGGSCSGGGGRCSAAARGWR